MIFTPIFLLFLYPFQEFRKLKAPTICKACLEQIHEMFDFKSRCVHVEDFLTPYVETSNSGLNLKEIGVKETLFSEINLSGIDEVCRLCFSTSSEGNINLKKAIQENKLEDIFKKNLTEVVRTFYIFLDLYYILPT